ncbi:MAG: hypothetical protein FWF18_01645 [Dehalococcoidia bacterium]|nr:hypothetical protein [Dehalococcoidia bacterium]
MEMRKYWVCLIIPVVIVYVFAVNAFIKVPQSAGVYPNEFPLAIDLNRTVFFRGEVLSFTITVTNNSGQDVNIVTNGSQPCFYFMLRPIDNFIGHGEFTMPRQEILKAGESLTRTQNIWLVIPGVYILDVHYGMMIYDDIVLTCDTGDCWISISDNHVSFGGHLDPITIVVV